MKVALVHEFLTQLGGAERVLEAFHEIFPKAPVFTLIYDERRTLGKFRDWDIRTSFLQKVSRLFNLSLISGGYKWLLPLMPKAIERFDFKGYDLVLSDSSAFAKGVQTRKPTVHICYCHTPTRYIWQNMEEYVSTLKHPGLIKKGAKFYLRHCLKKWDYGAAQRPDFFIANSRTVQERIRKYYRRDSVVIYPPVDTEFFTPSPGLRPPSPLGRGARGEDYFFTASRLEPYKKIDLVIEAFNQLNLALKIAGSGSAILNLKSKISNPKIVFLGRVSDEQLRSLYQGAEAFIFPAEEDAGIMVLEALACGTPVVVFAKGGASEFVRDGENGILMKEQTSQEVVRAVKKSGNMRFDRVKLRGSVLRFDKEVFKKRVLEFVRSKTEKI